MEEEPGPLFSTEIGNALPPLYATEQESDPVVQAKLFTPWYGWTWFVTEFDGEDVCFGLVVGHEIELGYFSLRELEAIRGPGGLHIERDEHFRPMPLSDVRTEIGRNDRGFSARETPLPHQTRNGTTRPIPSPFGRPAIRLVETWLAVTGPAARGFHAIDRDRAAAAVLLELLGRSDREQFAALLLNAKNRITHAHIVSRGTIDTAPVHPREVFKAAVLANASSIIVGHNHPSGDVRPSREDRDVEDRLTRAGKLLGIPVLDSIIVGPVDEFYSSSSAAVHPIRP